MTAEQGSGTPDQAAPRPSGWRSPRTIYFLCVHTPITIASILVAAVVQNGLLPWLAVILGISWVLLLIPVGMLGSRLGAQSNAIHAAMDKVPRPRRCDMCGEVEPDVCLKPWKLATCPLRSIDTGQTYEDFLAKP
jgi:hypothetical protein